MTDPADPQSNTSRPRSPGRRATDRAQLPAPSAQPRAKPLRAAPAAKAADTAPFAAQVIAGGPQRGLKGGPETLDRARSTYLGAEYSGDNDRRPRAGLIRKTDI